MELQKSCGISLTRGNRGMRVDPLGVATLQSASDNPYAGSVHPCTHSYLSASAGSTLAAELEG